MHFSSLLYVSVLQVAMYNEIRRILFSPDQLFFEIPMKQLAIVLVSATLVGCAWRGDLPNNFYRPDIRIATPVPVTLGLISARKPDVVKYGMSVDYQLKIDNYICALQDEFRVQFRSVRLIDDPSQCPECGLFAYSTLSVSLNQKLETYEGQLRVDFYSPTKKPVVTLKSKTHGSAAPSAPLQWQMGINQALGGLLAASTIDECGKLITAVTARAVTELVEDVGAQVRNSLVFHPKKTKCLPRAWNAEMEL